MKYQPSRSPIDKSLTGGKEFFEHMNSRRSVRMFSPDPVPQELIEIAVRTANTAPSGANQQPWFFCATSDPILKHRIREAAEIEERENYEGGRMPPSWRNAISHLGTNSNKEYLDIVPWIVVCFAQKSQVLPDGTPQKNYYVNESVGLACGMFISSLHTMGLSTLTDGCTVPDLERKELDKILKVY